MPPTDTISYLWERTRTSLWFVPGVIALAAAMLAALAPMLDRAISDDWLRHLPLVFSGKPVGARAVLSTIATSMIATAGVVFSMTIVSLQLASSQFGPRLLRTFLRDRGNQIVLGVFVGIFIYCILVLPTIDTTIESEFVPHISVSIAVVLAIVGLGMFVYFIDHVAQSIHADAVIQSVANELDTTIDRLFPEPIGEDEDPDADVEPPVEMDAPCRTLTSSSCGYLRFINGDAVMKIATERNLFIRFDIEPGQYVFDDDAIASIWPADPLTDEDTDILRSAFVLGSHRTPLQDVLFTFEQLAEMAERALSPGINDPTTAMHCIDRIGSAMGRLVSRRLPSRLRLDTNQTPRVLAEPVTLEQILLGALDPIARDATQHLRVWERLLNTLHRTHTRSRRAHDRQSLLNRATRYANQAKAIFDQEEDRKRIEIGVEWVEGER